MHTKVDLRGVGVEGSKDEVRILEEAASFFFLYLKIFFHNWLSDPNFFVVY